MDKNKLYSWEDILIGALFYLSSKQPKEQALLR